MFNNYWFTKISGWIAVIFPLVGLYIFIPNKICFEYPLNAVSTTQNCIQGFYYFSIIFSLVCYIIGFIIAKSFRKEYLLAYNIYDFFVFLFNGRKSTIYAVKDNKEELKLRYNALHSIETNFFLLVLFSKFILLLRVTLKTIEQVSHKSYIELFFNLLYSNILISVISLIILTCLIGYWVYRIKTNNQLLYGLIEIVLGIFVPVYTLTSNFLKNKIESPNIYSLLLFIFLFFVSVRVIVSGFDNTVKGIKILNKDNWYKDYFK